MSASPECGGKCRALRGDRGKLAYTGENRFYIFLTLVSILPFLLTLTPFVSSADTFPDKRGQLMFPILPSIVKSAGTAFDLHSFLLYKTHENSFSYMNHFHISVFVIKT